MQCVGFGHRCKREFVMFSYFDNYEKIVLLGGFYVYMYLVYGCS